MLALRCLRIPSFSLYRRVSMTPRLTYGIYVKESARKQFMARYSHDFGGYILYSSTRSNRIVGTSLVTLFCGCFVLLVLLVDFPSMDRATALQSCAEFLFIAGYFAYHYWRTKKVLKHLILLKNGTTLHMTKFNQLGLSEVNYQIQCLDMHGVKQASLHRAILLGPNRDEVIFSVSDIKEHTIFEEIVQGRPVKMIEPY